MINPTSNPGKNPNNIFGNGYYQPLCSNQSAGGGFQ